MALLSYLLLSMLVLTFASDVSADYVGQSLPNPAYIYKLKDKETFQAIKIQGGVYCRKHGMLIPLAGAMARTTCMAYDNQANYAGQFSVVSRPTDRNGYFLFNLSRYQLDSIMLKECKVRLETPPPGVCDVPTDVNGGVTGASLTHFRTLHDSCRLHSLPPFVYDASPY